MNGHSIFNHFWGSFLLNHRRTITAKKSLSASKLISAPLLMDCGCWKSFDHGLTFTVTSIGGWTTGDSGERNNRA